MEVNKMLKGKIPGPQTGIEVKNQSVRCVTP